MKKPGEEKLSYLFQPGKIGKYTTKNSVKYGACCVSNYNTRDGFITPRELARDKVLLPELAAGLLRTKVPIQIH